MQRLRRFWTSGCLGKVIIVLVGFLTTTFICGFCGLLINSTSSSERVDKATEEVISRAEDEKTTPTIEIPIQPTITIEFVEVTKTPVPEYLLEAINVVANELDTNVLDVRAEDLLSMENPKGEGVFVYVEQTRFSGVERYILWLVLDGTAYALNGATKDVTPSVLWPREAQGDNWSRTNLDMYQATEAIEIVFGK